MKKIEIIPRNFRILGARYVFLDFFYQFFRFIHSKRKTRVKEPLWVKKEVNDYIMWVNRNGKGVHRDLWLHGTREKVSYEIAKSLIKEGNAVLEAGANIGYYAIMESKKVGNKGIVYAVEPIKESFELLKKNIKLNKLKNVKCYNIALAEKTGKIKINISSESNLNTPVGMGNPTKVEMVKSVTLDEFFKDKRNPDFMRMDIEGFEDFVFRGGLKTLDSLKTIFVELHFPLLGKERMISLLKLLKRKGFEIDKAVLEWERWVEEDSCLDKIVNYLHRKRSKPIVFKDMMIDGLMKNKNFMEGHHSLEVFFVKKTKDSDETE